MIVPTVGFQSQQALQAYQFSGKIEYSSVEYGKSSVTSGQGGRVDSVEIGRSTRINIEFSMSILQERTQSKIDMALPESQQGTLGGFDPNMDMSPEATAERIVDFATGFLDAYKMQHSEMSDEEATKNFMELIRGAIDEGFAQAKDIITSLNAMSPELDNTITETYDLVQQGLDNFFNLMMEQIQEGQESLQV